MPKIPIVIHAPSGEVKTFVALGALPSPYGFARPLGLPHSAVLRFHDWQVDRARFTRRGHHPHAGALSDLPLASKSTAPLRSKVLDRPEFRTVDMDIHWVERMLKIEPSFAPPFLVV